MRKDGRRVLRDGQGRGEGRRCREKASEKERGEKKYYSLPFMVKATKCMVLCGDNMLKYFYIMTAVFASSKQFAMIICPDICPFCMCKARRLYF